MAMLDTIFQSLILSVLSSILAQLISTYQANKPLLSTSNIDPNPIGQFAIYTIVNVPINILWQRFLESSFPAPSASPPTAGDKNEKLKKSGSTSPVPKESPWRSILIKFALDQTVGAAFNIPLFFLVIGLTKGQNIAQIATAIEKGAWPMYVAGLKLWPAVSLSCFAIVPPDSRILVGSLAGVVWNIYLSLM